MPGTYEIRNGYTEVMDFTLTQKIGADYVPFNLTGYTSVILIRVTGGEQPDRISTTDSPPRLSVTDPTGGVIRLTPAATYWLNIGSQVKIYFEVYLGGHKYMFPTRPSEDLVINIVKE
jgi:hypothetical protein